MTTRSQKSALNRDGRISQCANARSTRKLKNYDVQGDEKHFPTADFRGDIGGESDLFGCMKIKQKSTTHYTQTISSGASYGVQI